MFAVIYRFETKPGQHTEFIEAWQALTELIYQYRGSLGSRLHKEKDHCYIAYAQWPSQSLWEEDGKLPEEAQRWRAQMKNACTSIQTLHCLEIEHDLLQPHPFNHEQQ